MDIEEPNCLMLPCFRQRHGRQCSEASAAGEWARSIQIPRGTEKPHRSMSSNRSFSRRSQLASHVINWLDATLCLKRTEVTRHCIQQDEMGTRVISPPQLKHAGRKCCLDLTELWTRWHTNGAVANHSATASCAS